MKVNEKGTTIVTCVYQCFPKKAVMIMMVVYTILVGGNDEIKELYLVGSSLIDLIKDTSAISNTVLTLDKQRCTLSLTVFSILRYSSLLFSKCFTRALVLVFVLVIAKALQSLCRSVVT